MVAVLYTIMPATCADRGAKLDVDVNVSRGKSIPPFDEVASTSKRAFEFGLVVPIPT